MYLYSTPHPHQNLTFYISNSVAEDPSGATVCTTQWNKNQSCYTSVFPIIIKFPGQSSESITAAEETRIIQSIDWVGGPEINGPAEWF